jgi:hypothetical protein
LRRQLATLSERLALAPAQRRLWDGFLEQLLRSIKTAKAGNPGSGWDVGASPALNLFRRLEIATGRLLSAVEATREAFDRFYGALTPDQRQLIDAAMRMRK